MARRFDKYELRGAYHWHWYGDNKWNYRTRIDRIVGSLPSEGTILDAGCGDGLVSYRLFEHGLRVHGVDSSAEGIRLARRQAEKALFGANRFIRLWRKLLGGVGKREAVLQARYRAGELRFTCESLFDLATDDAYDHVVCLEVIEHVPEPRRLLELLYKAARRSVLVTTPDGTDNEPREYDEHLWTPAEFQQLLDGYPSEEIKVAPEKIAVVLRK